MRQLSGVITMSNQPVITAPAEPTKLPYETPLLIQHGDVRDFTMGGTTGVGDSGNTGVEEP
jgi:hypothetical protein